MVTLSSNRRRDRASSASLSIACDLLENLRYGERMELRKLGASEIDVSVLGFGAGHIGGGEITDEQTTRLVHFAIESGINLIDTARGYGASEERIGRALEGKRDRVVLSTKGGYGVDGVADWTGECVTRGIDQALARLRTDRLDIFHLHSCPADVALREDILTALDRARTAGKIRVAAYSGENDDLRRAVESGMFGSVQLSINVCDRNGLRSIVPEAAKRDIGVIGKRPLANAPWRYDTCPKGEYVETYWNRFRAQKFQHWQGNWGERAVRFAAFAAGVTSVIVGTRSIAHLQTALDGVRRGKLVPDELEAMDVAWKSHGADWRGEI